jgi:hypothetical protein
VQFNPLSGGPMQLRDYIIRRLLILPILIFGVSVIVFTLM